MMKKMDNELRKSHPWSNLTTITTFDEGNDQWIRKCMNDITEIQTEIKMLDKIVPSKNLLIESLLQQLCTMLEKRQSRRKKLYLAICERLHKMNLIDDSYHMEQFEMLRNHYQRALYHLVSIARSSINKETILPAIDCYITDWSRYNQEFEEIALIGSGGFGKVYRALNRLDGTEYAIKKISVNSSRLKTVMQHLVEVKTIAKLNHTNIVSYKSAWIEPTLESDLIHEFQEDNSSSSMKYNKSTSKLYSKEQVHSNKSRLIIEKDNLSSNDDNKKSQVQENNSHSVSFRNDQLNEDISCNNTSESDSPDELVVGNRIICPYNNSLTLQNQKYSTLYIQMALCDKTLREWLNDRVEVTPQPVIAEIVMQILNGLDYIHSLNIVHHDIKPSNIFISTTGKLQVQLGDFGLSCPLRSESHHTSILGTHMYAAPEQLKGKCDPKSDIYSLGIVLVELLLPMHTRMELSRIIESFKLGNVPMELETLHPKWSIIVNRLLKEDPIIRPSTSQLLKECKADEESIIAELKYENDYKNNVIEDLQVKIAALQDEVNKLKTTLSKN